MRSRRRPRISLGDPDEEVGREEGPEYHHLGDDEKQHPEQLRLYARAAVCGRRTVMLGASVGIVPRRVGDTGGLHQAFPPVVAAMVAPASTTTCSTCTEVAWRTRSMRLLRSQPERSLGSVEMTMSSTWKSSSAFITAV